MMATPADVKQTSPSYKPFFDAISLSKLVFPYCEKCGRFHWYPKTRCPHCGAPHITWRGVAGAGTLYSFTIVHRAFTAEFEDKLPYTLALVEFADAAGVRLLSQLRGSGADNPKIGMGLRPVFPSESGEPLLTFIAS